MDKKRVCLIGLDGVSYSLIKRLMANGIIPNLASVLRKGDLKKISVSIPEISAVSWTSFMTGVNSGTHGIFGFLDIKNGTRDIYFPNYRNIKAKPIWSTLGKFNKRSLIVNLPSTYPARPLNGILVSGFVGVDIENAVYPSLFIKKLKKIEYKIDLDLNLVKGDPDLLFGELYKVLNARFKAFSILSKELDWDFFMPVITGTDRLHHFLWSSSLDRSDKYYEAFFGYYKYLDEKLGYLLNTLPKGTIIMAISDHGFTKIECEVNINRWLVENKFLFYKNKAPEGLNDICPETKAFAIDPSRIYLNKKSRFNEGTVLDRDVEPIIAEISDKIADLKYEGKKVISHVCRGSEIYSGNEVNNGPDLVLLSNHGFDFKGRLNSTNLFEKTYFTGMHTQDDAFFFSTSEINNVKTIFDVKGFIERVLIGHTLIYDPTLKP